MVADGIGRWRGPASGLARGRQRPALAALEEHLARVRAP
jgi:hypothetical protein